MINRFQQILQILQYFGAGWLAYRLGYAARMKSGLLRLQIPAYEWEDRPLHTWLCGDVPAKPEVYTAWRKEHGGQFFFQTLPVLDDRSAIDEAESILEGRWRYYENELYEVDFPPNWHYNPATERETDVARHWSQIGDSESGDIKFIWEASRFGVAFRLVRAYAANHDERYPAAFWQLIEDWAQHNPPQRGANWKCGQEAALRLTAWCFGLYGFATSVETTPARVAQLATMIAAHADRIERNIAYARSQKNNHGISEGVGLWMVSLLFPEFKRSEGWRDHGRRIIIEETRRQIYPDGAYVQHSTNYHRLMLHDCIWALRLGEVNNARLPDEVYNRVAQATDFLYQLIDMETGSVPNYGANDGALVLPLSGCDYRDFRPVVQAAYYLCHERRLLSPGAWDEDLLWLFGAEALDKPVDAVPQTSLLADVGGYYTLRGSASWALIRCAQYHDRPGQADQLHVDLWWKGNNIACDAGTYLYNDAPPWDNGLSTTNVHNTISVDDQDQMTRAGRFLWLDWAQGQVKRRLRSQYMEYWEGEHGGYRRLSSPVLHRRGVLRIGDEAWLVLDECWGAVPHDFRLHWLFPDWPHVLDGNRLELRTPSGPYHVLTGCLDAEGDRSFIRADEGSVRGWRSLYYGQKLPALSWALVVHGASARFWTVCCSTHCNVETSSNTVTIDAGKWQATVSLEQLLGTARLQGDQEDILT